MEDGQFAKIYKGNLLTSPSSFALGSTASNHSGQQNGHVASGQKQIVSIKVPRVPEAIRKEKSKGACLITKLKLVIIFVLSFLKISFLFFRTGQITYWRSKKTYTANKKKWS